MTRLATIALALIACAAIAAPHHAVVARKNVAVGAEALHEETFDTASGYDLSDWEEVGDPDPDHTGTVLEGTQSLELDGNDRAAFTNVNASALSEGWVYSKLHFVSASVGFDDLMSVNYGLSARAYFRTRGTLEDANGFQLLNTGGTSVDTGVQVATNTTYEVLLHYTVGSGSDTEVALWVTTDGDFSGAANVTTSNGTWTDGVTRITLQGIDDGGTTIWDDIKIGDTKESVTN